MNSRPRHRRASRLAALAVILLAAMISFERYQESHGQLLAINVTDSLTHWAFLVDRTATPERGDLVLFVPPDNPYYQGRNFVKRIAGAPGDLIERHGRRFFVNGDELCIAKRFSRGGYALEPGPVGIIPPGHFFVFAEHEDSYDSRYKDIGWISRERIIGVVQKTIL